MHFIVTSNGSYGDVYPLFGLAHALAGRGHEVTLVSNERYAPLAGDLEFVVGSSDAALEETIDLFDVSSAFSSAGALLHGLLVGPMREFHRAIVDEIRPGESAIVAFPLVLGARLAHDQLGVPFVSCQLAPSAFRSVLDPPRTTAMAQPTWMPGFMLRGLFGLLDRMVDRWTKADVNAYRAELGLAPARGILSWMDSPQKVLGLFPDWFGAPQDDWPAHVEATAFPQFDAAAARPMDESLSRFLDAGPPPIVLTAGSPAKGVVGFYRHAADACERLGRRGVLVTRYADDVPRELPDGVVHASYAPFSDLLPRAAALVHHGGIGSCAQGLGCGVPQLTVPWGMDQFDNSMRLKRLGVGRELPFGKVTGERLAASLGALLDDGSVPDACERAAARFDRDDPTRAPCEAIERFADSVTRGEPG